MHSYPLLQEGTIFGSPLYYPQFSSTGLSWECMAAPQGQFVAQLSGKRFTRGELYRTKLVPRPMFASFPCLKAYEPIFSHRTISTLLERELIKKIPIGDAFGFTDQIDEIPPAAQDVYVVLVRNMLCLRVPVREERTLPIWKVRY